MKCSRSLLLFAVMCLCLLATGCKPRQKAPSEPASLAISVPYEVDSFDPHATITISNYAVLSNFYEPLVRTDASMKVLPCLAKSWENPKSNVWLFELERTVRFHSGRPLTAEDVAFSLKRLISDTRLRMRAFLPEISEVKALGPYTVQVTTAAPIIVFLNKLNFALIIPKGSTSESLAQNIDGTGPYKMNGWKKGEFIRLSRNEDYWGTKPQLEQALMYLERTPEEAIQDLVQGKSRIVQSNTKKLEDVVRTISGHNLLAHNSLFVKLLGFDLKREETPFCSVKPNPFRIPEVREAIHLAINRNELISRLSTQAVPATQPVPAFIFGFNPDLPAPGYDLARARALLQQAGFPQGFRVTLHSRNILMETASNLQAQLGKIGIIVDVASLSDEQFFAMMNRREASLFLTRWGSPSGDASDILDDIFHSEDGKYFGDNNFGGFSDPLVDQAIEASAAIQTVEERRIALQAIMVQLMKELPMIPLYTDVDAFAMDQQIEWQPRNDSYILVREIGISKKK